MRIRTLKWQALTVQGRASSGAAREEAGTILADLTSVEMSVAHGPSPSALRDAEDRVDAIGRRMAGIGTVSQVRRVFDAIDGERE